MSRAMGEHGLAAIPANSGEDMVSVPGDPPRMPISFAGSVGETSPRSGPLGRNSPFGG
jgi:hypothetical protein